MVSKYTLALAAMVLVMYMYTTAAVTPPTTDLADQGDTAVDAGTGPANEPGANVGGGKNNRVKWRRRQRQRNRNGQAGGGAGGGAGGKGRRRQGRRRQGGKNGGRQNNGGANRAAGRAQHKKPDPQTTVPETQTTDIQSETTVAVSVTTQNETRATTPTKPNTVTQSKTTAAVPQTTLEKTRATTPTKTDAPVTPPTTKTDIRKTINIQPKLQAETRDVLPQNEGVDVQVNSVAPKNKPVAAAQKQSPVIKTAKAKPAQEDFFNTFFETDSTTTVAPDNNVPPPDFNPNKPKPQKVKPVVNVENSTQHDGLRKLAFGTCSVYFRVLLPCYNLVGFKVCE